MSEEGFIEVITKFDKKLQQKLQNNSDTFSQALAEAMEETRQVKEDLKALLGGCSAGRGDAELKKVPLRDQLVLAEKMSTDKTMKEVAEWAGRFKQVARKRQKTNYSEAMARSGVAIGNEIERLLPDGTGVVHASNNEERLPTSICRRTNDGI